MINELQQDNIPFDQGTPKRSGSAFASIGISEPSVRSLQLAKAPWLQLFSQLCTSAWLKVYFLKLLSNTKQAGRQTSNAVSDQPAYEHGRKPAMLSKKVSWILG